MEPINEGISLLKKCEGLRLTAYKDVKGWAIGYGARGPFITEGTVWSLDQAERDLYQRVSSIYEKLKTYVTTSLKSNQWGALISLSYNVGVENLKDSHLIRDINNDDMIAAEDQFLAWNHIDGVVSDRLTKRRTYERTIFSST